MAGECCDTFKSDFEPLVFVAFCCLVDDLEAELAILRLFLFKLEADISLFSGKDEIQHL